MDTNLQPVILGAPILIILIFAVIAAAIGLLPFWFICKKAGLSPFLSLLMLVPLGALVLPWVLAFIEWPALRQNKPPEFR